MTEAKFIHRDLEFSRSDIEHLAQHLDSVLPELSGPERALLLAIFAAARDHVSLSIPPKGSDDPEPTLAELRDQILNAFIPNEDNEYNIQFRIGPRPPGP